MYIGAIFQALRRNTTSGRFLPEIDGLRFVSIMSVVLFHILTDIARKRHLTVGGFGFGLDLVLTGNFGVQVFFAISGFILALPFAEWRIRGAKPVELKRYYLRRVTRIEPPYIINMLFLFVCLPILAATVPLTYSQQVPHLLASFAYVHGVVFNQTSTLNGVAWSLEIEVQFYILAPVLCQLFRMRNTALRRTILFASMLAVAIVSWGGLAHAGRFEYTLIPYLAYFLAGFYVADLYCASWNCAPGHSRSWDYAGLAAIAALIVVLPRPVNGVRQEPLAIVLLPFLAMMFIASAFRSKTLRQVIIFRPFTVIGGMCYTIYLYHFHIISAVGRVLTKILPTATITLWNTFLIMNLICLPAVLVISALLFLYIEKPFMSIGVRKRMQAGRMAGAGDGAAVANASAGGAVHVQAVRLD